MRLPKLIPTLALAAMFAVSACGGGEEEAETEGGMAPAGGMDAGMGTGTDAGMGAPMDTGAMGAGMGAPMDTGAMGAGADTMQHR